MPTQSLARALTNRSVQDTVRRTMSRSHTFQLDAEPSQRILKALEALERIEAPRNGLEKRFG